jgi:gliding motility-associated-like protein
MVRTLLFVLLNFLFLGSRAQFVENKGQWNDAVHFKLEIPNGVIWFEESGWKIVTLNEKQFHSFHEAYHQGLPADNLPVDVHALEVNFTNSNSGVKPEGENKRRGYHNYYLGNKREQWASNVGLFDKITYRNLYDGIDAELTVVNNHLKVTYVVSESADPTQIQVNYLGNRGLNLTGEQIEICTSTGSIIESGLYSYQNIDGEERKVNSSFVSRGAEVSFQLEEFDSDQKLYIDPTIIASTNSGSTVTCYGHTATYDNPGNMYAAGRCFGVGYPTDTGSFQMNFASGGVDMGISKYSPNGSQLIYATYLGGAGSDLPHSMFVNSQGQLHMLGTTTSTDFPVTINAFDTSYNGGNDLVVTIFNDSGSAIVGSTYIGGSGSDGVNLIGGNYGDAYRGEVVVDGYNSVYIATVSASTDFPTTNGVFQDTLAGGQDAVIFKLNFNLSQLTWSTYIGGAGNDAAYGVKLNDELNLYVSGSTQGQGFPEDSSGANPTYLGGDYDGFVLQLKNDASEILHSSYFGSDLKDQNFFVQLDQQGFVYLFGQSAASLASTAGLYQGPSLGTYIYKTSPTLDTVYWTSGFGNMSPVAFLVDLCSHVYVAGQNIGGLYLSNFDTLNAVLNVGNAGFYLMALSPDGTTLEFGSFFGNSSSHVDGGTSRFDKRGFVYAATCSAGAFPTTSWAYSPNNQAGSYDVTAFKIDFEVDGVVAYSGASPGNVGCLPFTVDFNNFGSTGAFDFWDFGDGNTSNDSTPTYTYDTAGVYKVTYVSSDTTGCNLVDTNILYITVLDSTNPVIEIENNLCVDSLKISASNVDFSNLLWSTGAYSNEIWIYSDTTVWLEATNACGVFTDTFSVDLHTPYSFDLMNDTGICDPNFLLVGPSTAVSFQWSTGDTTQSIYLPSTGVYYLTASDGFCSDSDSVFINISYINFSSRDTVICLDTLRLSVNNIQGNTLWSTGDTISSILVDSTDTYWVRVENGYCSTVDTILVTIDPLTVKLPKDTGVCKDLLVRPVISDEVDYLWSDGSTDSTITVNDDLVLWLEVNNGNCIERDSMNIFAIRYFPATDNLKYYCDSSGASLRVIIRDESNVLWSTGDTTEVVTVNESGTYYARISEGVCNWNDTFDVYFGQSPIVTIPDVEICAGDTFTVVPDTNFTSYYWSNDQSSKTIVVRDSGLHWVDINNGGCQTRVEFRVRFIDATGIVSQGIPNAFTPNGDGINDAFAIKMTDYSVYNSWNLLVYNRWGSMVYSSSEPYIKWDGYDLGGNKLNPGVYFYVVDGTTICVQKENVSYRGSVHILE